MTDFFLATALFCSCALAANAMDSRSNDPINLIPIFGDTIVGMGDHPFHPAPGAPIPPPEVEIAGGYLYFYPQVESDVTLHIVDTTQTVILEDEIHLYNNYDNEYDISALPAGTYTLILGTTGREYEVEFNIPRMKFEKFWEVMERNYISYTPSDKWVVESDTLSYVFDNDGYPFDPKYGPLTGHDAPINRKLGGMLMGRLAHQDGKCLLAMTTYPKRIDGKKLTLPLSEKAAKEHVFTRVANHFELGKPIHSLTRQALRDAEMLVTNYPAETAKNIFNGTSMFVYPQNFQAETYEGKYTCGRCVVVFSKNNIPLELHFLMTDESIADFDKYLSDLKGVFTFQDTRPEVAD